MSEWETFCDISYYHLWRVRRKDERGFNDGYHLQHGEEAKALVELLNRLERERVEVSKDLEFRRELYKVQEQYLETARRERDEAQNELSSIHKWIDRNHADGFIDSLTYFQNLERLTDNWYDRLDRLEIDAGRFERERDELAALATASVANA
jgi:hypothetical protein